MKTISKLGFLCLAACGEAATGQLDVVTYGEDFIEQQIPAASTPGEEGMVDNYVIEYDRFLIAFSDLAISDKDGVEAFRDRTQRVFDMKQPGPHLIDQVVNLEAGRWDEVAISVTPAQDAAAGNADAADVSFMNAEGYSLFASGRARSPVASFSFAWGFRTNTRYKSCVDSEEELGFVMPDGGRETIEFTVHGDHLFYDDLQSDAPSLRFTAMADADTNQDRVVSMEELRVVDLATLPSDQYGTGGAPGVKDLGGFVEALTSTLVHFQGEGHCVLGVAEE